MAAPTIVVGVDAEVAVEVVDVARLAEVVDPEAGDRHAADRRRGR